MPIITINLLEGRKPDQKDRLIEEVTAACHRTLEIDPTSVRIILNEMALEHYAIGGVSKKKAQES